MNIQLAEKLILEDGRFCPMLGKDAALLFHFLNYPTQCSCVVGNIEKKITVKEYVSMLPMNSRGKDCLMEFFSGWYSYFVGFEKKILDILSENPGQQEYLFLRSSTFLNNRESWKKKGIEDSRDKIEKSYSDYLNRICKADTLREYYVIKAFYDSKILANKFTHQLYDLRKTMEVSGFAGGEGYSLVPLMIKYEEIYETPIEEYEVWNGEI